MVSMESSKEIEMLVVRYNAFAGTAELNQTRKCQGGGYPADLICLQKSLVSKTKSFLL